jgi:hypothetical protein
MRIKSAIRTSRLLGKQSGTAGSISWYDFNAMSSLDHDGPFFLPLRGGPKHSWTSGTGAFSDASKLSLTRAVKTREGEWSADEYDVLEGNRRVGRIVLTAQGPQGMPWLWEITARPDSSARECSQGPTQCGSGCSVQRITRLDDRGVELGLFSKALYEYSNMNVS